MAETRQSLTRREFLPASALSASALSASALSASAWMLAGCSRGPSVKSPVFVGKAASYTANLTEIIQAGITACKLDVRGKNVLLKPNLVEYDSSTAINTHVSVIAAALEVFRKAGAASVLIGEGPGHRRDTIFLAREASYPDAAANFDDVFVDLNRDDVDEVKNFALLDRVYFPKTALRADLIVSLAKMKTHHWAGATLSMKNLFGLVPGSVYGWPKNFLHQVGITKSIVELNQVFRKTFAIVDGIVGMEGNGPIQGSKKQCGVVVMGPDVVAVDATCCRIMGIDPDKLEFLQKSTHLGVATADAIEQRGEKVEQVRTPFALIPEFAHVRLA